MAGPETGLRPFLPIMPNRDNVLWRMKGARGDKPDASPLFSVEKGAACEFRYWV
jgi:hypothetical protein